MEFEYGCFKKPVTFVGFSEAPFRGLDREASASSFSPVFGFSPILGVSTGLLLLLTPIIPPGHSSAPLPPLLPWLYEVGERVWELAWGGALSCSLGSIIVFSGLHTIRCASEAAPTEHQFYNPPSLSSYTLPHTYSHDRTHTCTHTHRCWTVVEGARLAAAAADATRERTHTHGKTRRLLADTQKPWTHTA